jgi:hypothetical protein
VNYKNLALSRSARLACLLLSTTLVATWLPAQTIKSLSVNPKTVGGVINSKGTVTLSAPAPTGGAVVTLSSGQPSIAQVPASVTVPQGVKSASFTVSTSIVFTIYKVTISAAYKTSKAKTSLTVQTPRVYTAAGGFVGDKGPATKACVMFPQFGSLDSAGNVYVADDFGNRIRMYNLKSKVITTVAGDQGEYGYNGEGIPATKAAMGFPRSVLVFDSAGDFYYTDDGSNRIRAVVAGIVNTIIGNGNSGYSGDGGVGTNAMINQPTGLALDASGNLYFADTNNAVIRMWNPSTKIVSLIAGTPQAPGYGGDGGSPTGPNAQLNGPRGIAFDGSGTLYIADTTNNIVRIVTGPGTQGAVINTVAGMPGNGGYSGDGGQATQAQIGAPRGVLVNSGLLYISNAGHAKIRTVDLSSGIIQAFAGSGYGYDGGNNTPLQSKFETPTGMMMDASGDLLLIDAGQSRVRRVTPGSVPTFIGGYSGDGNKGIDACLVGPENMSFNSKGGYYVVEANGDHVRYVQTNGIISTVVDTSGVFGYTGDGGSASVATIAAPMGVAADTSGNVYVADNINNVIRVVNSKQVISTFDADPSFVNLVSLMTDAQGNVYSVDSGACVVREITPQGVSTVIAGTLGSCGYGGDGGQATNAQLNQPYGIAMDAAGNTYIGDAGNNRVRVINTQGIISTFAGQGQAACTYGGDGGPATSAQLCQPSGVTSDPYGHVFIADYGNNRIRVVDSTGTIYTYIGSGLFGFNGDGRRGPFVNVGGGISVGIGPMNTLFYVDDLQYRVRKVE